MSATAGSLLLVLALAKASKAKQQHSYREQSCLAYSVEREAGNQSERNKKAVLQVLLHRMSAQHKTCRQIVSQPAQFSWWRHNIVLRADNEQLQSYEKYSMLPNVLPRCAQWFHSTDASPEWARKMRLVRARGSLRFYC